LFAVFPGKDYLPFGLVLWSHVLGVLISNPVEVKPKPEPFPSSWDGKLSKKILNFPSVVVKPRDFLGIFFALLFCLLLFLSFPEKLGRCPILLKL